jgi:hypothetical protein
VDWLRNNLGCNTEWQALSIIWKNIDTYISKVDQNLCSNDCRCYLYNFIEFKNNDTLLPFYKQWDVSYVRTETYANIAFQNCSVEVQHKTIEQAKNENDKVDFEDTSSLISFFKLLENKLNCVGFCNLEYNNTETQSPNKISKYLFTDINRGPPQFYGCLELMISQLPKYLKTLGICSIAACGLQLVLFIFTVCLCYFKKVTPDIGK